MQRGEYMKYKVQLFIGGSTIWFKTYATSNQEAEENDEKEFRHWDRFWGLLVNS